MGRSVCERTSRGRDTGWPGDQEPAPIPPRPLRRSHSGSSWLRAGPHGRTHIHTPRRAASLPPSSPFPSPCSRVPTAPPGQPRARRARAPAPGAAHLGAAAGPGPGSHRRSLASTQLRQPASRARPLQASPSAQSEDEHPGPGTKWPLNFVDMTGVCLCIARPGS